MFLTKPSALADLGEEKKSRLKWLGDQIMGRQRQGLKLMIETADFVTQAHTETSSFAGGFEAWVEEYTCFSRSTAYNLLALHQAVTNKVIDKLPMNAKERIEVSAYYLMGKEGTPQKLITAVANTAGKGDKVRFDDVKAMRLKLGLSAAKPAKKTEENGQTVKVQPDIEEDVVEGTAKDATGRPVPPGLVDVFQFTVVMKAQLRTLATLMTWVQEAKTDPATSAVQMDALFFQLRDAKETLLVGLPHAVCPYCGGKGCAKKPKDREWCAGRGWLVKTEWDGIPEERRK